MCSLCRSVDGLILADPGPRSKCPTCPNLYHSFTIKGISGTLYRMKRKRYSLTEGMLVPANTSAIILLGMYTVAWGLWLISPAWHTFGSAKLYSRMAMVAPEEVWGLVAVTSGLIIIYGVIRHSYHSLIAGSAVGAWFWMTVSVFYYIGDWHNTGGLTSMALSLYSGFIYVNTRVNKEHVTHLRDRADPVDQNQRPPRT